jgi:anti-anti-sigma regulatory factor
MRSAPGPVAECAAERFERTVAFSLFKKEPKDDKAAARPTKERAAGVKPIGKPLDAPVQRGSAGLDRANASRELARSLALETAAKIDAIESEMARDFLRPAANTVSPAGSDGKGGKGGKDAKAGKDAAAAAPVVNSDEAFDEQAFFGGSANAIELQATGSGSIIDETAILFANGQIPEAEAALRAGIESDALGDSLQTAWLMLFELVNQRGDKAGFEQLILQYALGFENSPPAWVDYAHGEAKPAAVATAGGPAVRLPAALDAQIVQTLEQLKQAAGTHKSLTVDFSACKTVDLVGAELVLRVLQAFKRSAHELTLIGIEQLHRPLTAAVEAGRRDASDAAWMLLLEVLRLMDRPHDFEETAIQYCVTFEVSPPSWEAAPANFRLRASGPATAPKAAVAAPVAASTPLEWVGAVDADADALFNKLAAEGAAQRNLSIDCARLRRVGFGAATSLIGTLMKLQASGTSVEFRHVNPLIVALFNLVGASAVATVHARRS